jgi:hypothetical protein
MSQRRALLLAGGLGFALPAAAAAQSITNTPLKENSVTVGGYGEVHFTNVRGPETPATINLRRFVVYLANAFTDRLSLRSEIEWEDAKVEPGQSGGEISIEQLFLDYRFSDAFTLRTGLLLSPIAIVNETHEPPTFNGVQRPDFEHDVIPTTWRELGIGAAGAVPGVEGLAYRVYLLNGLRAEGFSAAEGIRGGRQEGQEASFANPSFTGRLEWAPLGLNLGGSFWYGGSSNQVPAIGTGAFDAPVAVVSLDARYETGGFGFRGAAANVSIGAADRINSVYGNAVGSRLRGGYVEGAYDLLRLAVPASSHRLNAFVRYEHYDTHSAVPAGVTRDPTLARRITTFGLTYKPLSGVAVKGDYQLRRNQAGVGETEVLSLGVGYQF